MPFLLIKQLAPYIAIVLIAGALWSHGYYTANEHRIELVARLQAESDMLLKQATEANDAKARSIDASNKHIEEISNANRQIIESLADHNRDLANRVRFSAGSRCGAVSNDTGTTSVSSGTNPGTGEFWQKLVDESRRADEVTETARACQNYAKSLEILK